jgi:hypothetical protein
VRGDKPFGKDLKISSVYRITPNPARRAGAGRYRILSPILSFEKGVFEQGEIKCLNMNMNINMR